MRNFKKLKTIKDYSVLDAPMKMDGIPGPELRYAPEEQAILRMLVRPKYNQNWFLPNELKWLWSSIMWSQCVDTKLTGIEHSFCYVTVRRGLPFSKTDDEWHFDGSSFRTDLIPERNYIWVDHTPTEYKVGNLDIPNDFDLTKYNLFTFAAEQLKYKEVLAMKSKEWYMFSPFVLHRRPKLDATKSRTFIRICFTDIEGRDINNTQNTLLHTDAYGRDPVRTFRNELHNYKL